MLIRAAGSDSVCLFNSGEAAKAAKSRVLSLHRGPLAPRLSHHALNWEPSLLLWRNTRPLWDFFTVVSLRVSWGEVIQLHPKIMMSNLVWISGWGPHLIKKKVWFFSCRCVFLCLSLFRLICAHTSAECSPNNQWWTDNTLVFGELKRMTPDWLRWSQNVNTCVSKHRFTSAPPPPPGWTSRKRTAAV